MYIAISVAETPWAEQEGARFILALCGGCGGLPVAAACRIFSYAPSPLSGILPMQK